MSDHKCAFSATQMQGQFGCAQGFPVARRNGPDIACHSESGYSRCARLYDQFKVAGLMAMGLEDNPLIVPHSAWLKMQFGGLLALQRRLGR